jgi:hypothetical protein
MTESRSLPTLPRHETQRPVDDRVLGHEPAISILADRLHVIGQAMITVLGHKVGALLVVLPMMSGKA